MLTHCKSSARLMTVRYRPEYPDRSMDSKPSVVPELVQVVARASPTCTSTVRTLVEPLYSAGGPMFARCWDEVSRGCKARDHHVYNLAVWLLFVDRWHGYGDAECQRKKNRECTALATREFPLANAQGFNAGRTQPILGIPSSPLVERKYLLTRKRRRAAVASGTDNCVKHGENLTEAELREVADGPEVVRDAAGAAE